MEVAAAEVALAAVVVAVVVVRAEEKGLRRLLFTILFVSVSVHRWLT